MKAIIISCTAVARDAFEIGHVRKVALMGRPFPTFPNGVALRRLLGTHATMLSPWIVAGLMGGAVGGSLWALVWSEKGAAFLLLVPVANFWCGVRPPRYFCCFWCTLAWG